MQEKLVMKYAEAAEALNTTKATVKAMVKAGTLKGVYLLGKQRCSGVTSESVKTAAQGRA